MCQFVKALTQIRGWVASEFNASAMNLSFVETKVDEVMLKHDTLKKVKNLYN